LRFWLALLLALAAAPAWAASGPYVVDDSEILDPGGCKLEAWASRGGTGDHLAVVSPACTFTALPPFELGVTFARGRADGVYDTLIGPKLKTSLLPIERFGVGVGFMVSGGYSTSLDRAESVTAFVPLTVVPVDALRLSLNLGWSWDRASHRHYSFSGLGGEWQLHPRLALVAEAYGLDSGRWGKQIGLRPTLIEDLLDLDLVYGHDIDGSRSDWFSLGGILRF